MKKLLFVYPGKSSFVERDLEILKTKYLVYEFHYKHNKSIAKHLFQQIKIFFWLMSNIVSTTTIFVWFADYHSFLPILFAKFFRKKSFIVLGGYDVVHLTALNYGSFNNPIRGFCAKYSMNNCTQNFAVSDNIKKDALVYTKPNKVTILYTGYDGDKFPPVYKKKKGEVLSVCEASTMQRAIIKGVDLVLQTAKGLPTVNFSIVALDETLAKANFEIPSNVSLIKKIPLTELTKLYQTSSVYLQLSLREGLPNSVCEAMLSGCVPVGTNSGGIPIAIGEAGFIANSRNPKVIAKLIEQADNSEIELRKKARERILNNFSLELRKKNLLEKMESNYE